MSTTAEILLWGTRIGAVSLPEDGGVAAFEYDPAFIPSGIEPAPIEMPLKEAHSYRFPRLSEASFSGLPGMLADSLPDRYGNALIDAWLATQDRTPESFNAIERLCYIGRRGMGALEFRPARGPRPATSHAVDVEALAALASEVMAARSDLAVSLKRPGRRDALREILRVGTSAGGARPKALIALNPATGEVRSGQLEVGAGFEHWIVKFDGIDDSSRELGASQGYGAIELAYARMAQRAGIEMSECRLLEEGRRRHFMTRRFDRTRDGGKIHMQSLAALAHLDYNQAGAHSYEQAFQVIRRLGLSRAATEQQFRRMVFNVVSRNQDDHVKNIAFLMDRAGRWSLSPAFDVVYSYNPQGSWTARHQMSINGKTEGIAVADLRTVADLVSLPGGRAESILSETMEAVRAWPELASEAGVEEARIAQIAKAHILELPQS